MEDRLGEEEWKKVEIIGYCPLMSQGANMVDCKKEECTWWRQAQSGRPKGKAACAVNELISQLGTLDSMLQITIKDLVSQLVIFNGRFQASIQNIDKK
ncbi:MAG: hypothetical protein A2Y65_04785 [Deltaproteobacteria bacterium RBG_13_52_11]|nr:MAG: hypothetical protein A2Y65_04785 [Deltaproteobacteria bacterium RBG_13_52_11]